MVYLLWCTYKGVQCCTDLDACLPDYGRPAQVPGDGDHSVFADPVGQAVVVLGVAQTCILLTNQRPELRSYDLY